MTTVQPHCLVSDSIRPSKSSEAAPVYGVDSEQVEVSVEDKKAEEDKTETPGERTRQESGEEDKAEGRKYQRERRRCEEAEGGAKATPAHQG